MTLDLRPSGLPIIIPRGATRIINFVFPNDQTGAAFSAFIATRINLAHVVDLPVTISGATVAMTIAATATVIAAGAEHYWVLTLNGEPYLYDLLEVSSVAGNPTTSQTTVSVRSTDVTVQAILGIPGFAGGIDGGAPDAVYASGQTIDGGAP